MKKNFDFLLTGKSFFWVFFSYLLITILCQVVMNGAEKFYNIEKGANVSNLAPYFGVLFGTLAVLIIASVIYQILILRKVVPQITFDGQPFAFKGKIGEFAGVVLLGLFLTIITIGIYCPWFMRKISVYVTGKTEYRGTPMGFASKGGKLFLILLLSVVLPLIAIIALLAAFIMQSGNAFEKMSLEYALLTLAIFIVLIPFIYKCYQWYVNGITWNGKQLNWDTKFWRSVFFILGQMVLSIITIFIYFPAAIVRLYRYFISRTRVMVDNRESGRFSFEGKIGQGFLLLWGQLLLSIITLFIYSPWAVVKLGKWFAQNTVYIRKD